MVRQEGRRDRLGDQGRQEEGKKDDNNKGDRGADVVEDKRRRGDEHATCDGEHRDECDTDGINHAGGVRDRD